VGEAITRRFGFAAERATVGSAADPGLDVWQAVVTDARGSRRAEETG